MHYANYPTRSASFYYIFLLLGCLGCYLDSANVLISFNITIFLLYISLVFVFSFSFSHYFVYFSFSIWMALLWLVIVYSLVNVICLRKTAKQHIREMSLNAWHKLHHRQYNRYFQPHTEQTSCLMHCMLCMHSAKCYHNPKLRYV